MSEVLAEMPETTYGTRLNSIGKQALWGAGVFTPELGVNDPLTHLEQYLVGKEAALTSIDEDLITDIAERKLKPKFVNSVDFDRVGNDFISRENKFSMRGMTSITESKFANDDTANLSQYKRAKIEAQEVDRLNDWFQGAGIHDVFITESMPLDENERYTIVRIYEKAAADELVEHVVTLHNSTVDIFNQLHSQLGIDVAESQNKLELLDNMYALRPDAKSFVETYVKTYDSILAARNAGQEFSFGLPKKGNEELVDDIDVIRRQSALRSVYLDTVKVLGQSKGYVTPEVATINHGLGGEDEMLIGDWISFAVARELLDRSLQSVVATFNRASPEELEQLAAQQDKSAAYSSAGQYGGEARTEGVRYDGACPSSSGAPAAEAAALAQSLRINPNKDPSQCGTCPNCKKEYYVEEKIYKAKVLECNNCHAAVRFGGGSVSKAELGRLRGQEVPALSFFDSLAAGFSIISSETKINKLREKERTAQNDFQQRRARQLIAEEFAKLEKLSKAPTA